MATDCEKLGHNDVKAGEVPDRDGDIVAEIFVCLACRRTTRRES